MKVLVTGGAGFIGSHTAEFFAKKGCDVVVFDNLSRQRTAQYNWEYLKRNYKNVELVKGDVAVFDEVKNVVVDVDTIVHTAAQVAVTTSMENPRHDFNTNVLGTFNVLEAARQTNTNPTIVYCSTNKVYGENVNKIPIRDNGQQYMFDDARFENGIPETFSIDNCEHTPYGCSKLTGDLYVQDYGRLYGLKTGIFRMSCIYGTRQFGNEDQGWVAHFVLSTLNDKLITIYGDGKQVRDVLFVTDLVRAYDAFIKNPNRLSGQVFNMGGGKDNILSLTQLLDMLEQKTGKRSKISFDDWRPSDQKVYISDIAKTKEKLGWKPEINPEEGVSKLCEWVKQEAVV